MCFFTSELLQLYPDCLWTFLVRILCNGLSRAFDVDLLHIAERFSIPVSEIAVNWHEIPGTRTYMKKKKKITHRQLGPLRGSSSPFQHFEPARVKPD